MDEPAVVRRGSDEMNEQMALKRLGEATDKEQFEMLKGGAAYMSGFQARDKLNKKNVSMSDIRLYLDDYVCSKQRHGLELLYALCEVVGCSAKELDDLYKLISPTALKQCKECHDFKFVKMIINISNDMTTEEYKTFFDLCLAYFEHRILFENYSTIAHFFTMLIERQKVVWPGNVKNLYEILEKMGKINCLKFIDEYRQVIGNLGQPEDQESTHDESPRSRSTAEREPNHLRSSVPATDNQHGHQNYVISPASNPLYSSDKGKLVCNTSKNPSQRQELKSVVSIGRGPGATSSEDRPEQRTSRHFTPKAFSSSTGGLIVPPTRHDHPSEGEKDNVSKKQVHHQTQNPKPPPAQDSDNPSRLPYTTATAVPSQHIKGCINTAGPPCRDDVGSEEDPLLVSDCHSKNPRNIVQKTCSPKCKKIYLVLVSLVLSLAAIIIIAKKGFDLSSQTALANESQISKTVSVVKGDTILLGTVNAGVVSKVTVDENGDKTDIYLVPENSLNKHTRPDKGEWPTIYQPIPSRTYANVGAHFGKYLLENSTIRFVFNIAYQNVETGKGHFYIFNDGDQFNDYTNGVPGAEKYAVCNRQLNIGTSNVTLPTSIEFSVDQPSYYFMAADTPADIYSNVTYEIKEVYLDHLDYDSKCESMYASGCSFELPEDGIFSVLGYVEPEDDEGYTTDIQLTISGMSQTLQKSIRLSTILVYVASMVALIVSLSTGGIIVFILCVCKFCTRTSKHTIDA